MSAWKIRLPVSSREDDLADVACWTRQIEDPEERAVAYQIAVDAATSGGMRTAGELLDRLEQMTQPQRRKLHNRARVQNGLETVEDGEAHARFVAANEMARRRAAARPTPTCAICGVPPMGAGGMPAEVPPARKWHCAAHEHLAAPGDMEAPAPPITTGMREINPDEIARAEREDERRREEERRRAEERKLAAREAREVARLREEQFQRELFGGRW